MSEKTLNFIINLLSYKPESCFFRIVFVCLIGFLCSKITVFLADDSYSMSFPYISFVIVFVVITELNVLFDFLVHKYGSERMKSNQFRNLILFNLLFDVLAIFFILPLVEGQEIGKNPFVQITGIFTLLFIVFIILDLTLLRLLQNYVITRREVELLRQAQIMSEYQSLVNQVNPHFLFNNLSVLKSLIAYDKEKALVFIQNFTDIYRYVLQTKDKSVVLMSEEMNFIKSYIDLHRDRIGEGLNVTYDIEPCSLDKYIVPLSLQILIENALKHNIASKSMPLHITITATNNYVEIKNNLNRKEIPFSTKKGLENISKRYKMLTESNISVTENMKEFNVRIPLI